MVQLYIFPLPHMSSTLLLPYDSLHILHLVSLLNDIEKHGLCLPYVKHIIVPSLHIYLHVPRCCLSFTVLVTHIILY
jgi:hypothetical protein